MDKIFLHDALYNVHRRMLMYIQLNKVSLIKLKTLSLRVYMKFLPINSKQQHKRRGNGYNLYKAIFKVNRRSFDKYYYNVKHGERKAYNMLSLVFENYYCGTLDQLKLTSKRMKVRNAQNEGCIKDRSSSDKEKRLLLFIST